ncbi:MAG: hypothetical protein MHM6MM_002647 [Cercozoa sp. M6MM]
MVSAHRKRLLARVGFISFFVFFALRNGRDALSAFWDMGAALKHKFDIVFGAAVFGQAPQYLDLEMHTEALSKVVVSPPVAQLPFLGVSDGKNNNNRRNNKRSNVDDGGDSLQLHALSTDQAKFLLNSEGGVLPRGVSFVSLIGGFLKRQIFWQGASADAQLLRRFVREVSEVASGSRSATEELSEVRKAASLAADESGNSASVVLDTFPSSDSRILQMVQSVSDGRLDLRVFEVELRSQWNLFNVGVLITAHLAFPEWLATLLEWTLPHSTVSVATPVESRRCRSLTQWISEHVLVPTEGDGVYHYLDTSASSVEWARATLIPRTCHVLLHSPATELTHVTPSWSLDVSGNLCAHVPHRHSDSDGDTDGDSDGDSDGGVTWQRDRRHCVTVQQVPVTAQSRTWLPLGVQHVAPVGTDGVLTMSHVRARGPSSESRAWLRVYSRNALHTSLMSPPLHGPPSVHVGDGAVGVSLSSTCVLVDASGHVRRIPVAEMLSEHLNATVMRHVRHCIPSQTDDTLIVVLEDGYLVQMDGASDSVRRLYRLPSEWQHRSVRQAQLRHSSLLLLSHDTSSIVVDIATDDTTDTDTTDTDTTDTDTTGTDGDADTDTTDTDTADTDTADTDTAGTDNDTDNDTDGDTADNVSWSEWFSLSIDTSLKLTFLTLAVAVLLHRSCTRRRQRQERVQQQLLEQRLAQRRRLRQRRRLALDREG